MKKTSKKTLSKRTAILLIAAVLLLFGGIGGAAAAPSIQSQDYTAWFYLNHLQVHLLENGQDVCGGENTLDGASKVTGDLATNLGYKDGKLGNVEPGKVYEERIQAENGQDIPQFVRLTVRKYWVEVNEDGTVKTNEDGTPVKVTTLSPDQILLVYSGAAKTGKASQRYNKGPWQINPEESTTESSTYYYTKLLGDGGITEPLFDQISIDGSVAKEYTEERDGNTITYVYKYDGCAFMIEADVQAIQNHHAQDAIHSQWGVYNVTVSGDTLSVGQ